MDALAFKDLIIPYQDKLFRFALGILSNKEEAKDVVQDIILKLWERKDSINKIESVEAWMMKSIRNRCIDLIRSKGRNTEDIEKADQIDCNAYHPGDLAESNDLAIHVRSVINQLPKSYKHVILLRDIEGYSYEEISEILELSLSQVKVTIHRARKKVKEGLEKINIHGNI